MKELYDELAVKVSKKTTNLYSTSFSLGIWMLNRKFHEAIYSIYGWVRLADEIVDSFHGYEKRQLLNEFREETHRSIARGISLNPIIHSFQEVVREFNITPELYNTFLESMEMDLDDRVYDQETYEKYILGSAEVVGLMCLKVFVEGKESEYDSLKATAKSLGSAFQKVNFLRDLKADSVGLGRIYFPGVNFDSFSAEDKQRIEQDILKDFDDALVGIRKLPSTAKFGVYTAYGYYKSLYRKIKRTPSEKVMEARIRIPNWKKLGLTALSYCRYSLRIM